MVRLLIWIVFWTLGWLQAESLKCVASIPPLQRFVDAIGGERVSVRVMVPQGKSPHSYEPLPSQMKALSDTMPAKDCLSRPELDTKRLEMLKSLGYLH